MSNQRNSTTRRLLSAPLAFGIFLAVTGCGGGGSSGGGGGGAAAVTVSPEPNAAGVPTNTEISATFATDVDPATLTATTFRVRGPGSNTVPGTISYDAATRTATFYPTSPLLDNTAYTLTITTGVEDPAGNAVLASDFVCTFTTDQDTTAPTVTVTSPASAAVAVATNTKITVEFSEPMSASSISGTTFLVTEELIPANTVNGTVAYSAAGNSATFTPGSALSPSMAYVVTVTTGVEDVAGRNLASNVVFGFTTGTADDTTQPTVTSTNPASSANNVALNKSVNATFSEAMDPTTITGLTYTLTGPGTTAVSGALSYDATSRIATFNPNGNLAPNTTYTATLTTTVADVAGNQLLTDKVWSFTTGSQTQTQGGQLPINLRSTSNFAVLAGSAITNTGNTVINGNVGLAPGSSVGGFPPGVINGTLHVANTTANTAKLDLTTAYNEAQGRSTNPIALPGNLGGLTLAPGLYVNASSVVLTGTGAQGILTLDAQGDSTAVWVFQVKSSFTTSSGTSVVLAGGAKASNIFWAVGSTAILGTTSSFSGTIMAETAVNLKTGATLNGRALALSAEVTFEANTVTRPSQ